MKQRVGLRFLSNDIQLHHAITGNDRLGGIDQSVSPYLDFFIYKLGMAEVIKRLTNEF